MNCSECREFLVTYVEGLLDGQKEQNIAVHLNDCHACQAEVQLVSGLHNRLARAGKALAGRSSCSRVMEEILREQAFRLRRTTMIRKYAKQLSMAAAVVLLAGGLLLLSRSTPLAFADVQEQIRQVGTRPYACTSTVYDGGNPPWSTRVMRIDLTRRREIWPGGRIIVFDLSGEPIRMLTLMPERKFAIEKTFHGRGPTSDPDLLGIAAAMKAGSAERLGAKTLNARNAEGFHSADEYNDITVWADPESGLPIQIEIIHVQTGRRIVMNEFDFDVDFDEALFSTTAPEGYTVQVAEEDTTKPRQQDLGERTFRPYTCTSTLYDEGKQPHGRRIMRLDLTRRREVWPDGAIHVFDFSQRPLRQLTLYPEQKLAVETAFLGMGPARDPDFLGMLSAMQSGSAEDLGTEELEGRTARGFRTRDGINDITIWADTQTGLPIRIEIIHVQMGRQIVMNEFDFDVQFDESLFSTKAPEGYTVRKEEVER